MYIYFIYIYKCTNLPVNAIVRLPILGAEISRPGNVYSTLCKRAAAMIQSAQTTIPPCQC